MFRFSMLQKANVYSVNEWKLSTTISIDLSMRLYRQGCKAKQH